METLGSSKKCVVCGDKAQGFNFNVVSCESCKAFFRRNALSKKAFNCNFNNKCEITVTTRRFCQKCRLQKCLNVGMKVDNIMSEEEKILKRRKIQNNRKRRGHNEEQFESAFNQYPENECAYQNQIQTEVLDLSQGFDKKMTSPEIRSCESNITTIDNSLSLQPRPSTLAEQISDLTGEQIVDFILIDPEKAVSAIDKLMRNSTEALRTLEKIIHSQKDALRLIAHLINYPGHGLKIISKVMNSPFDALTVFAKFISSPTDALEIISKVVNSPEDVLQFIKNLMETPENAIDIMNKFMNSPAEALRLINQLFNATNESPITPETEVLVNNSVINSNQCKIDHCSYTSTNASNSVGFSGEVEINPQDSCRQKNNEIINEQDNFNPNHSTINRHHDFQQNTTTKISNEENDSNKKITITDQNQIKDVNISSLKGKQATVATIPDLVITFMDKNDKDSDFQKKALPAKASPQIVLTPVTSSEDVKEILSHNKIKLPPETIITSLNSKGEVIQFEQKTDIKKSPNHSSSEMTSPSLVDNSKTNSLNFTGEDFDVKAFMQNILTENAIYGPANVDGKSLESLLSEVIRIEFQYFNNLPVPIKLKNYINENKLHSSVNVSGKNIPNLTKSEANCGQNVDEIILKQLNDIELIKLRELKLASEALYLPVDVDLTDLIYDDRIIGDGTDHDPKLLQVINLTAVAIKRLIMMAKKITAFREMCQEDQVALLKGGCTEMMIMRSVIAYDYDRNTWKIPHTKADMSNIRAEILKLAKGNVYEEHLKFIRTFDEKWRTDDNIILLLCAIVLFTPTRSSTIHTDVIRLEQNTYYYLLRRYLESIYIGCEAKSIFIKLIQKIADVSRLSHFIIDVYLNVNPSQIEPLLREIFDLKNQ